MPIETKTRRSGFPVTGEWWTYSLPEGKVPLGYLFNPVTAWNDTRTGINLPGWRMKILQGQDATTDLSAVKHEVLDYQYCGYDVTFRQLVLPGPVLADKTYSYRGCQQGVYFGGTSGSFAAAEQLALMKLYKNIRKNHTKFQGLVFLGELRQAIKMVKRPAESLQTGLVNYIDALKKRSRGVPFSPQGNKTRKRILADTWLEYSFGWTPLISDIKNGAEALASWKVNSDGLDERRSRITGYGSNQDAALNSAASLNDPFYTSVLHVADYSAYGEATVRLIARLSYKTAVPAGSARRLLQLSGFTLSEFIPTAWELLPWSFLIDYFSNVGDVLEAFSTPTDNIYSITRTLRQVYFQNHLKRLDVDKIRQNASYVSHQESGYGTSRWISKRVTLSRSSLPSLDLPRLQLENPFGKNASVRAANIIALAAGARPLKPFYR